MEAKDGVGVRADFVHGESLARCLASEGGLRPESLEGLDAGPNHGGFQDVVPDLGVGLHEAVCDDTAVPQTAAFERLGRPGLVRARGAKPVVAAVFAGRPFARLRHAGVHGDAHNLAAPLEEVGQPHRHVAKCCWPSGWTS
eukprot:scaffold277218_cov36-Prasinocladus_malaysianus.AAC.2